MNLTLRGAFINTAQAQCSIFESGSLVFDCIKTSDAYQLDYFTLDQLDVQEFDATGEFWTRDPQPRRLGSYDFWVFNWHFVTMAALNPARIAELAGLKFSIVLELSPDDPLELVPPHVFDGYIALDPTAQPTEAIFPFPRPLPGQPLRPEPNANAIPVIGSFGFGTPGKGFEILVEAVNREFDRAIVRVNIPIGTNASFDHLHGMPYPQYLAALCKRIAKPGIEVRFSFDFMSSDELVRWCADNDLNCFMYTRRQPGLAATTDQAIMSGRPLLTLSNDTFRHIHSEIPPYPAIGLREAIVTTQPAVRRLQQAWSQAAFAATFAQMLAAFGLLANSDLAAPRTSGTRRGRVTVLVASRSGFAPTDVVDYSTRLADSLGRSTAFRIVRVRCADFEELASCAAESQPAAVVVVGFGAATERAAVAAALQLVSGPKIILTDEPQPIEAMNAVGTGGIHVIPRQPIVPFYTVNVTPSDRTSMTLVGFTAKDSGLEEILGRVAREAPGVELRIEAPVAQQSEVATRASVALRRLGPGVNLRANVSALPVAGDDVIAFLGGQHLTIFASDPQRGQELEDLSSLAMITGRAVAFTRRAPLACYRGGGTFIEDVSLADALQLGVATHIGVLHDFGEWQVAARIGALLDVVPSAAPLIPNERALSYVAARPQTKASFTSSDTGFVYSAYTKLLGRPVDPGGLRHHLGLLKQGVSREAILAGLRGSPEAQACAARIAAAPVPMVSQRQRKKPRLVIASDRCFTAGDRRMRRSALLYAELGRTFDVVAVTRSAAGETPATVEHAPGFREVRVPRTNAEAEWQAIASARWGPAGGDDVATFDRVVALNPPFMHALRAALDGAALAVSVQPYAFRVVRALADLPVLYDALVLEYPERVIASRTAPNRLEFIEKISAIEAECVRGSAAIISGDPTNASLTSLLYGIDRQRVAVLRGIHDAAISPPLGHTQRRERRAASIVRGEGPVVLFVGSQTPSNGRAVLALATIAAQLPSVNFILAGRAAEIASAQTNRPNIKLLGYVDDATFTTLLQIADLFVHPALDARVTLPSPLLDAVAHGAPLILTPQAAAGVFRDGYDADVAPIEALPERIASLLNDSARRERQSIQARETAQRFYSAAEAGAAILTVLGHFVSAGVPV